MKKITFAAGLLFFAASTLVAQDLKKARTAFTLAQFPKAGPEKLEEAKAEVDKLMADPKSQGLASTLVLKSEVYGAIAGKEALAAKYPTANAEAFDALKKYLALEPDGKTLKDDNYAGLNEIYKSFFSQGVKEYNAKNWEAAFDKWKQVVEVSDIMIAKKWSTVSFDTTAYLYAGVTAQNAKKEADAVKYYSALASLKIPGNDYLAVYDYVTKYHLNNKNSAEFTKYVGLAKEVYPKNDLWSELEFSYNTRNNELPEIEKNFLSKDAASQLTANNYFDYGNFFVNDKRIRDMEGAKKTEYTRKAAQAFTKAYQLDSSNLLAIYNTGVTYYAIWETDADAARAIKGVTPEIKAKRSQADKVADASADKSIEWLEKAFTALSNKKDRSNVERSSLNKSVDLLFGLYNYKRDRARGVNVKDYDKYDAKMKTYDSLHGKF
jgi:hypothetical protein